MNVIKIKLKSGVKHIMEEAKTLRTQGPDGLPKKAKKDKFQSLFKLASSNEINTVQGKVDEFLNRVKYY